jgi:hypothetical protein
MVRDDTNDQYESNIHPQITIQNGDRLAEVDVGIAPLVLALWRSGLDTVSSCEGFPPMSGLAYIAFPDRRNADPFVAVYRKAFREYPQMVTTIAEDIAPGSWAVPGIVAVVFPPERLPVLRRRYTMREVRKPVPPQAL